MSSSIGIGAAFLAGLVSFLSPCVLPLIPGYLSFMTGMTTAELASDDRPTRKVMVAALLFVAGFSLVFVAMGATASVLGSFLSEYRDVISRIFGVLVIGFGVLMLGIIKVPWLYGEARADMGKSRAFGRAAAFAMGMAFGAGWTPCVGPILGVIIGLAASSGSVAQGAILLLAYSAGLGVPFLLVAWLFSSATPVLRWLGRHSLIVNRVAGGFLIALGLLLVTGRFETLANWLNSVVPNITI